ncbi:MAG: SAM hydrolase/SAM-dependent halogenase family protein [Candidatus Rokuibacteriota bacterium]
MAVITLTTDFGTRDAYVAEMKGAILSITRDVHVVDVTHDVAPRDILEGALALEAAAPRFPAATIHVAVVDPGVGTARRGLVVAAGEQLFVGPDNGLFTPFLGEASWRAFELRAAEFRGARVSPTFHGRDIFAPAAAHLARGVEPERFGPAVTDPVRLVWPEVRVSDDRVGGAVVHVDRFGNLVTSIHADAIASLGSRVAVRVGGRSLPLVRTYTDLRRGDPGALLGSSDRLEIAVNAGSAAKALGARPGTPVVVSRTSSGAERRARRRT